MVNAIEKGKRGEREFAKYLRDNGVPARRGQQHAGGEDSPDVVHLIDGVHFEVKRTEKLRLDEALRQACQDASVLDVPVVAWKKNRQGWVAILPMDQLLPLLKLINRT